MTGNYATIRASLMQINYHRPFITNHDTICQQLILLVLQQFYKSYQMPLPMYIICDESVKSNTVRHTILFQSETMHLPKYSTIASGNKSTNDSNFNTFNLQETFKPPRSF